MIRIKNKSVFLIFLIIYNKEKKERELKQINKIIADIECRETYTFVLQMHFGLILSKIFINVLYEVTKALVIIV